MKKFLFNLGLILGVIYIILLGLLVGLNGQSYNFNDTNLLINDGRFHFSEPTNNSEINK